MTDQPNAPKQASTATFAIKAIRAHVAVALRAVTHIAVTLPDDGGPITVTAYGRTIQITTQDITDQQ